MASVVTGTGTAPYLIDILKEHLAKVRGVSNAFSTKERKERADRLFGDRKYYNQAFVLLIIGACKPVPAYIINLSDLTRELKTELSGLDIFSRKYVAKQAVGRVFEDIESDLYHNSISRVLEVKFEK